MKIMRWMTAACLLVGTGCLLEGCSLHVEQGEELKQRKVQTLTFHVGDKDYPIIKGEGTFVSGQALTITSAVLTDATKAFKAAASGGANIVVEVVEFATRWMY